MPSTIGSLVAANYLVAKPSTQFGTRQLTVINIAQTGVDTDYALSDSLFSKTIRAVQQTAEVWAVFTPTSGNVKMVIASTSQWDGQISNASTISDASFDKFEAAIQAGSGVAATVTIPAGFVAPFHG